MVPPGRQERVFRSLPLHMLRPAQARRGAGDSMEAQHHGLFHALLPSGDEGIPQQGKDVVKWTWICLYGLKHPCQIQNVDFWFVGGQAGDL